MAELPQIDMALQVGDQPVVIVGETPVTEPARLLELAPVLLEPDFAAAYAQLVNHLAHGYEYSVILDPDAYEADYRADYAGAPRPGDDATSIDPSEVAPLDPVEEAEDNTGDGGAPPSDAGVDLVYDLGDDEVPGEGDEPDAEELAPPGSPRSFGLPDFSEIVPPRLDGDRLVFFARHSYFGIPYRVTVDRGALPDYAPLAMAGE